MTYIVGINNYGASSIICDTQITYGQSGLHASYDALKSGKLFPGCIYGAAGDFDEFRKFIISMRNAQPIENTLSGFWDNFCNFVSKYKFLRSKSFQLLLATRHSGDSELYLLDSTKGSILNAGNLKTIGSGKNILDNELKEIYEHRNPNIEKYMSDEGVPIHSYPYLYCLWLMERVQGMEVSILNRNGVGGYFHFTGQTSTFEARQSPAVYVISESYPSRKEIRHWIFRIAFLENALVVDCPIEQTRLIVVDVCAWPQFNKLNIIQREQYFENIIQKAGSEQYYYFCGFGFLNPKKRKSVGFHFTTQDDYIINRKGEILDQNIKRLIEENFSE